MSEQHTREPWKFIDVLGGCSVLAGNREVLRYSYSPDAENKANARRLVACVNACVGVPTNALALIAATGGFQEAVPGELRDELMRESDQLAAALSATVEQRDRLLEALKLCLNAVILAGWEGDFCAEQARPAIAAVEHSASKVESEGE